MDGTTPTPPKLRATYDNMSKTIPMGQYTLIRLHIYDVYQSKGPMKSGYAIHFHEHLQVHPIVLV